MRILTVILILCVLNPNEVFCENGPLTVLLEEIQDAFPNDRDGLNASNFAFSSLQSSGLIESFEKSRTGTIEERLDGLIWKKIDLETKLREAMSFGSALSIFHLMKERFRLVRELNQVREELIGVKLEILDKKRQVVNNIVESEDPISFDLFMQALSLIYGEDLAPKVADLRREAVQTFERPFLRPVIAISSPSGLPRNCSVVTAIYQNFKRQNTSVLKNNEFTIVTTVTGFTADNLHLGVDFYAVNQTDEDPDSRNSSEEDWSDELLFQREVIENQMNLTQTRLLKELEDLKTLTKQQKKSFDHKRPETTDSIEKLEEKLVKKSAEINYDKIERQVKLISKQLERQRKFLLDFEVLEKEALEKLAHVTKKIHKKQENILDEKLKKKKAHDKRESKKAHKKKKHGKGKSSVTSENSTAEQDEVTESVFPTPEFNVTVGTSSTEAAGVTRDFSVAGNDTEKPENETLYGTEATEVFESLGTSPKPNFTLLINATQALNQSGEIEILEDEVSDSSPEIIVNSTASAEVVNDSFNQTQTPTARWEEDNLEKEMNRTSGEDEETRTGLNTNEGEDVIFLTEAPRETDDPEV